MIPKVCLFMAGTLLLLLLTTAFKEGSWESVGHLWGFPIVSISQDSARGLIAIGQFDARGVLVIAQVGGGIIALAQGGVGIIFGIGQGMVGLLAFGQATVGLVMAVGQVGFGGQSFGMVSFVKSSVGFGDLWAVWERILSPAKKGRAAPAVKVSHIEARAAGPPEALIGAWEGAAQEGVFEVGGGRVEIRAEGVWIHGEGGEAPREVSAPGWGSVQVSRSSRRRAFSAVLGLLGRDPMCHLLHVELRHRSGFRFSVKSQVERGLVEGLAWLEQPGEEVERGELLSLLGATSRVRLPWVKEFGSQTIVQDVEDSVAAPTRIFVTLQACLRGCVRAILFFPVLMVPKGFAWWLDSPISDYFTVGYVALLVVFFALVAAMSAVIPLCPPSTLDGRDG